MKKLDFLQEMIQISETLNKKADTLKELDLRKLTHRPHAEAWNTLEIIEHLNYYIEIYNQHFTEAFKKAALDPTNQNIKRGYFGNKFIKMMDPEEGGSKKMKTFRSKDTMGKKLSKKVIDRFMQLNETTIEMLYKAKEYDIQSIKCKLAIPILKLKLADAMHFIVAHNKRHFEQIERTLPKVVA